MTRNDILSEERRAAEEIACQLREKNTHLMAARAEREVLRAALRALLAATYQEGYLCRPPMGVVRQAIAALEGVSD